MEVLTNIAKVFVLNEECLNKYHADSITYFIIFIGILARAWANNIAASTFILSVFHFYKLPSLQLTKW